MLLSHQLHALALSKGQALKPHC